MALNVAMTAGQYMIVRVTSDGKNYTAWVVEPNDVQQKGADGLPVEPMQALGNRTTSASTMGTNVQGALPTLST